MQKHEIDELDEDEKYPHENTNKVGKNIQKRRAENYTRY